MSETTWVILLRARFAQSIDGTNAPFPTPEGADIWRFAPVQITGDNGLPTFVSDVWAGFASFRTRDAAEAVLDDPLSAMPFLSEASEVWRALAVPVAHHGSVLWRETVDTNSAFVCDSSFKEGPLVVLTTAGYDADTEVSLDRVREFISGIEEVLAFYRSLPGNRGALVATGRGVDGREGCTMTLWADQPTMLAAAYKNGTHSAQMKSHEHDHMFDRSSFSRLRVQRSLGTWDGVAPL